MKHEDLCGAFKGSFLIWFFICVVLPVQSSHSSLSSFLRGHAAGHPGTYWYTTGGSHPRNCRSCGMYAWFRPSIQSQLCVKHHVGAHVSFRFLKDRGSTKSTSKAQPVPLRFSWSTRTRPAPPPLYCQFPLQTKSSKASQHQRPPLSLPFPRSHTVIPLDFNFWSYLISSYQHVCVWHRNIALPCTKSIHTHEPCCCCPTPLFSPSRFWEQLQQLPRKPPLHQQPSRQSHLQVGRNARMGWLVQYLAVR